MGLFDGVKEAFSAPALEKAQIDPARETPIDRWMGWSVKTEEKKMEIQEVSVNFIDSMDSTNYICASLDKPMGIVFEENDEKYGGIFVYEMKEGGVAEVEGTIKPGDQLVGVNSRKVSGLSFDEALSEIVESTEEKTKLIVFRGTSDDLYGPTGASQAWLEEFVGAGGEVA